MGRDLDVPRIGETGQYLAPALVLLHLRLHVDGVNVQYTARVVVMTPVRVGGRLHHHQLISLLWVDLQLRKQLCSLLLLTVFRHIWQSHDSSRLFYFARVAAKDKAARKEEVPSERLVCLDTDTFAARECLRLDKI